MGTCLDRGIKVVANAGGLDPAGCAEAVHEVADRLGLAPRIGVVDRRRPAGPARRAASPPATTLAHLDTGEPLGDRRAPRSPPTPTSAAGASSRRSAPGADIVITGRVTDAAVVMAPAAHVHGWARTDWDRAGRRLRGRPRHRVRRAGHRRQLRLLHRGPRPAPPRLPHRRDRGRRLLRHHQAPGHRRPGRASARSPRSCSTRSAASATSTPTSSPASTPSSSARTGPTGCGSVRSGASRRRRRSRSAINYVGGYRNTFTFCLTGLDIEAKAALLERPGLEPPSPAVGTPSPSPAPSSSAPTTRTRPRTRRPRRCSGSR